MKQSSVLLMVFALMTVFCIGFISYDIVQNNRLKGINGPDKSSSSNWNWNDNWKSEPTTPTQPQPIKPEVKPIEPVKPQQQIVASSYKEALELSRSKKMPVLVYFEADWCGWCKKMKSETLRSREIADVMMHYIVVHVNADQNQTVVQKFGVRGLPSYVITNSAQVNLKSGKGFKRPAEFAKWLDEPNLFQQN